MGRRIGLLAAALVVAVLGTTAVFTYVSRVEDRAVADQEPVDVLVARERIPAGTTGDLAVKNKLAEVQSLPRKNVPDGALTTLTSVRKQKLVSDVFAGEVLLSAKFADAVAKTGALLIPDNKIAISVELGDPQRVAGFVVPGSEVAIFNTMDKANGTAKVTATKTGANTAQVDVNATTDNAETRLLLARAPVIAVGPVSLRDEQDDPSDDADEKVAKAVLTVAVTQWEAEKLVHAATQGELYFGLLSTNSKTAPSKGVTDTNLYG